MKKSYVSLVVIILLMLILTIALPIILRDYLPDFQSVKVVLLMTEFFVFIILFFATKRGHMYWINLLDYKEYEALRRDEQDQIADDYFHATKYTLLLPMVVHIVSLILNVSLLVDTLAFTIGLLSFVVIGYRVLRKVKRR